MPDPAIFPPIKKDHAAALGYVAAHWSLVEEHQKYLISSLLGLQPLPGHAVTAEISVLQRLYAIEALVGLTGNKEWITEWSQIVTETNRLRPLRNNAVHAIWHVVGDEHWGMRVKAKGRVSVTFGATPTADLAGLSDEILALEDRIAKFTYKVVIGGASEILKQPSPPGHASAQAQPQSGQAPSRPQARARKPSSRERREGATKKGGS
jgi:hypothetical protein